MSSSVRGSFIAEEVSLGFKIILLRLGLVVKRLAEGKLRRIQKSSVNLILLFLLSVFQIRLNSTSAVLIRFKMAHVNKRKFVISKSFIK